MSISLNPLVSVIVITYNSSKFVIDTLESVKAQTWANVELIISDDCSTDNTIELCSEWLKENEERFTNTTLLTASKNTGISANSNRGLQAASGEWIKTIAADDILLSTCIADNIEYSQNFPDACFIVSDVQEIDENGNVVREIVKNKGLIFMTKMATAKKQLKSYSRWPVFLNTPTIFCKRELTDVIDYCDEEFRILEDMSVIFKLMNKGIKIHYMDKPTIKYRIHPNAISRNEKFNALRAKEIKGIFNKYRKKNLNLLNPIDLSVYYEIWLICDYKGIKGRKGVSALHKLSLLYWYLKLKDAR